ncbi:unnamed protein product [Chrysoparadoxa australica]
MNLEAVGFKDILEIAAARAIQGDQGGQLQTLESLWDDGGSSQFITQLQEQMRLEWQYKANEHVDHVGFAETPLPRRGPSRAVRKYFRDKVVWVTGASSGLGESLAIQLAMAGAKVILSGRDAVELGRVQRACIAAWKKDVGYTRDKAFVNDWLWSDVAHIFPLDTKDVDMFEDAVQVVQSLMNRPVDILINNAGVSSRSLVQDTDEAVDRSVMEINFRGPVALTKAVLPSMLERLAGHVVVISGVHGRVGVPSRSSNVAAKHALRGYFDALRAEVAEEGVRVTVAYPGYINTRLGENAIMGDGSRCGKPSQGGAPPQAVARRILQAAATEKDEVTVAGRVCWSINQCLTSNPLEPNPTLLSLEYLCLQPTLSLLTIFRAPYDEICFLTA